MKVYQLKSPETVTVAGQTFEGDYIIVGGPISPDGKEFPADIVAKADFEAKYIPVPEAAPVEATELGNPNASAAV